MVLRRFAGKTPTRARLWYPDRERRPARALAPVVAEEDAMPRTDESEWLVNGPEAAERTAVLGHGAGQGMDSPFMEAFATGLARAGVRVVRFEFPYMRRRRETSARRPPDPAPVLVETWREVMRALPGTTPPVIGGKSLGGRIASRIADEVGAVGLVCLGYPFHPPKRPHDLRLDNLLRLKTRALIVQGSRDLFGPREEVDGYRLPPNVELAWIEGGDHSYRPLAGSERSAAQNVAEAVGHVVRFVGRL